MKPDLRSSDDAFPRLDPEKLPPHLRPRPSARVSRTGMNRRGPMDSTSGQQWMDYLAQSGDSDL